MWFWARRVRLAQCTCLPRLPSPHAPANRNPRAPPPAHPVTRESPGGLHPSIVSRCSRPPSGLLRGNLPDRPSAESLPPAHSLTWESPGGPHPSTPWSLPRLGGGAWRGISCSPAHEDDGDDERRRGDASSAKHTLRFYEGGVALHFALSRLKPFPSGRFRFASRLRADEGRRSDLGGLTLSVDGEREDDGSRGEGYGGDGWWESEVIVTKQSGLENTRGETSGDGLTELVLGLKPVKHSDFLDVKNRVGGRFPKAERNLESLVKLFLGLGYSVAKLERLFAVCSKLPASNLEKTILPKIVLLLYFGFTYEQVVAVISSNFVILFKTCHALEAHFICLSSVVEFHELAKVVTTSSSLIGGSITELRNKLRFLQCLGFPELEDCITKSPIILRVNASRLTQRSQQLKELLGPDLLRDVLPKFTTLLLRSPSTIQESHRWILQRFGPEKGRELIRKYPQVLGKKVASISAKVDFVCGFIDNGLDLIVKNPVTLGYSLQNRIEPRFVAARSQGLTYCFGKVLSMPPKRFELYLKKLTNRKRKEEKTVVAKLP